MQDLTPNNEATAGSSESTRQPPPSTDRVFISYAREDEAFVLRLARALKACGIPIWLDQWDIPPGADWDRSIDRALRESSKVIAVLSPEAVASPQVRAEIQWAVNEKKSVFPVLYKGRDVPRILRLYHFSDFRDSRNFKPELARLADALCAKALPHDTKPQEPPPKPPPWLTFAAKFGRLMYQRLMYQRLMPPPIVGATVIGAILVVLAVVLVVGPPSGSPPNINGKEPKSELRPLEQTGNLQVSVNVDEARVSLDGAEVGIARNAVPLILRGLSAGEHELRVEATGYVPEERKIRIVTNSWTMEGVILRQPAPAGR